jgi:hypothetical protein
LFIGKLLSVISIEYVSEYNDALDEMVTKASLPKFGVSQLTLYGGVPPLGIIEILPLPVPEQSPTTDIE